MATVPVNQLEQQPDKARAVSVPGAGEERTPDAPMPSGADLGQSDGDDEIQPQIAPDVLKDLPEDERKGILDVIRTYTMKWAAVKRRRTRYALKGREYLKGNQYISFDGERFVWYDPLEAIFEGTAEKEDMAMYRYVSNVYQMLHMSFVAALSPNVPAVRFVPRNAEELADMATAEAGSHLQDYIERRNGIRDIQKKELSLLWTDGCYFKYNRFVVDSNRWQSHKEPYVKGWQDMEVLPDRFSCQRCGGTTPAAQVPAFGEPQCQQCGAALSASDYYPAESLPIPQIGEKDVPNGMVTSGVYGVLNVTAAPYAEDVKWTPILQFSEEVDKASIRASYPDAWDDVSGQNVGGTPEQESERIARQTVYNAIGGRNNLTAEMLPTLSKTWIQDWAFNEIEDKEIAAKLRERFPSGCMAVTLGPEKLLEVREEKLTDHWTWCGTSIGYGIYTNGVGEVAMDVQDRINDSGNAVQEYLDRCASAPIFMDQDLLSTRRLNNKPNFPGTITEVNLKKAGNQKRLQDAMWQPQLTINNAIFTYIPDLVEFAQLVTGVLPQTFGGSDPNVKTATGQQKMLQVAMGRLGLFWDNIRSEHAKSAEQWVRIAANNYTEDVLDVAVGDVSTEFRNKYIYIKDLRGEFHAFPEEDQGLPTTWAENRDRWQELLTLAVENPQSIAAEMFQEPVNQKQAMMYLGTPGMVLPAEAERKKTLRVIQGLLEAQPTQGVVQGPNGQPLPIAMPSIVPDKDFDDLEVSARVVKHWYQEHYDEEAENPGGFANIRAYYGLCKQFSEEEAIRQQATMVMAQGPPKPAGPGGPPAPPPGGGK